jgi:hypothetical protein
MNVGWFWCVVVLVGCGREPPAGTGALEVVRDYHEALMRRDWPRAYVARDPDTCKRFSQEQFAWLAKEHLGFEPTAVHVRSCEERGDEASARVLFEGPRLYKDAVALRSTSAGSVGAG